MPGIKTLDLVVGWLPLVNGTTDGTGAVTLESDAPGAGEQFAVERMVIEADSVNRGTCRLYRNEAAPIWYLDGSSTANFDIWESPKPLYVGAGETLVFAFSGLDPGVPARVAIWARRQLLQLVGVDQTLRSWRGA